MPKISKIQLEDLYIRQRKSFRTIATELSVGKTTVEYYLKKYSIPRRGNLDINRENNFEKQKWIKGLSKEKDKRVERLANSIKKTYANKRRLKIEQLEKKYSRGMKEILETFYVFQRLSLEDISKEINFHRTIISELLDQYGIKKRKKWEKISKMKGNNHSQYGKSWEQVRGKEKAYQDRKKMSKAARESILQRLSKNQIPFENTEIERIMEKALLKSNLKFEKQYKIDDRFVCDFVFPGSKLVIECDGDYWHANPELYDYENLTKTQQKNIVRDKFKDNYLKRNGWIVLRFYETEIKNDLNSCLTEIKNGLL